MKLIWYLSSFTTVLLILLHSPKSNSFGNLGYQSQFFSYTRSAQRNIQLMIICSVIIFLLTTILLMSKWFN